MLSDDIQGEIMGKHAKLAIFIIALSVTAAAAPFSGGLGVIFGPTIGGHLIFTGVAPALTNCGTSPTIAGNDNVAHIIVGTSESDTCTVKFATPWLNRPICIFDDDSNVQNCKTVETTTTLTVTGTWSSNEEIDFQCFGYK